MQGVVLRLFMPQTAQHRGRLQYEWVLEQAHRLGIDGGTVFRAVAGYGRHGRLHAEHFFEMADELPLAAEFVTNDEAAQRLLDLLATEGLSMFYLRHPVEFGTT